MCIIKWKIHHIHSIIICILCIYNKYYLLETKISVNLKSIFVEPSRSFVDIGTVPNIFSCLTGAWQSYLELAPKYSIKWFVNKYYVK